MQSCNYSFYYLIYCANEAGSVIHVLTLEYSKIYIKKKKPWKFENNILYTVLCSLM